MIVDEACELIELALGIDRLLNNPWAQPPLPSDWEVCPSYPRVNVPYYLAPLWDQDMAAHAEAQKKTKATGHKNAQAINEKHIKVPKDLRERLKKAKAAKGLLRDLEEQVRLFVASWEEKTRTGGKKDEEEKRKRHRRRESELDSEEDEIVFVGRNGQMQDMPPSPKFEDSEDDEDSSKEDEVGKDRLVFGSLANDHGASFGYVLPLERTYSTVVSLLPFMHIHR